MKVVVVPNIPFSFMVGGQEVQIQKTIEHLRLLGCDVEYLDFESRKQREWADVYHFFGPNNLHLAQAAAERKPMFISPVIFWNSSLKAAYLQGSAFIPKTYAYDLRKTLLLASGIFPNSDSELYQLAKICRIDPKKIEKIPNGVDETFQGGDPNRFYSTLSDFLKPGEKFVLSVHRIEDRKNTLNLVEAADRLKVKLILIGALGEGKQQKYSSEVMNRISTASTVRYLGKVDHQTLLDSYAAAHVHALVSHWETTGLSSLEAGLNGCNLVVTECPPVREYFGDLSFICNADVESIATSLKSALNESRNGKGQAQKIKDRYSWRVIAEQTLRAYNRYFSDKRPS